MVVAAHTLARKMAGSSTEQRPGPGSSAPGGAPRVRPELSIVMPCLNEAETLATCIRKAQASLERAGVPGEVVIADNGSTDGSQELAIAEGARVVHVSERGYGAALKEGIALAEGRWVIMGDADDSYDWSAVEQFISGLRQGHDLVAGNRFAGGIRPGAMPWLHKLGNPFLTRIARRFFRIPVGDVYCGLRGFDRQAILALDLRSTGMEFAIEMVVKASLNGLAITEVPTTLSPDGRSRKPHLRTWRDGWRSLRFLLLYSPSWLFLYPGLAFGVVGVLGMLWRLAVGGSPASLVPFSVAASFGASAVLFSAFAKLFAISEGLLPPDERLNRMFRYVTLEVGVLLGALVLFAGVAALLVGFAVLDPGDARARLAVTGGTLAAVGAQVIMASFFLSILGLRREGNLLPDGRAAL